MEDSLLAPAAAAASQPLLPPKPTAGSGGGAKLQDLQLLGPEEAQAQEGGARHSRNTKLLLGGVGCLAVLLATIAVIASRGPPAGPPCGEVRCNAHGGCVLNTDGRSFHACHCDSGWDGHACDSVDCSVAGNCFTVSGAKNQLRHRPQLNGEYAKTERVCHGKPVYQNKDGGGAGAPVLYQESDVRTSYWYVGPKEAGTDCSGLHGHTEIYLTSGPGCMESPAGDGCAGRWQETAGAPGARAQDNPAFRVVASASLQAR